MGMDTKQDYFDGLLMKYLLHEATEQERLIVESWMAAKQENMLYYNDFKRIWDASKEIAVFQKIDVEEAWSNFSAKVKADEVNPQTLQKKAVNFPSLLKAAALFVILIGVGSLLFWLSPLSQNNITVASGNNSLNVPLPDGSTVLLNKHATLSYSKRFSGATRSITLTGEGFFNVLPDKTRPFVVTAGQSTVTVVGTSFNVKYGDTLTEIIVETGIVQVDKEEYTLKVNPQEKAIVRKNEKPVLETNTDELYNYYRTRKFVCKATPLYKLVSVLNEAYDAKIVITNTAITNMPLTSTFNEEPLDRILQVIAQTFNIKVETQYYQIILR
jgi:ferric-dicitrate binding protein FerR (iron transport regulator)